MKRLVVCCDGTWNKPDNETITNVEKIARTVQSDPSATGGAYQLVYYVSGVGAGSYAADRLLGGAFGLGLFHNVIASYRFLAQNYEPGDEIFIIGFSRGAYTARSVAGMVGKVGLLTKLSLVEERLPAAVHMYQQKDLSSGAFGASVDEFKHDHCHAAKVDFLGVFDTVGALGIPGFMRLAPRFHDVQLGSQVLRARHALAVDETRLKFAPTFWEAPEDRPDAPTTDDRVKQVWFEGAHSDVGGGYAETGLSDTSLLWMVREAHDAGLVFDVPLLSHYVNSGSDPIRHNPLSAMFKVDNLMLGAKMKVSRKGAARSAAGCVSSPMTAPCPCGSPAAPSPTSRRAGTSRRTSRPSRAPPTASPTWSSRSSRFRRAASTSPSSAAPRPYRHDGLGEDLVQVDGRLLRRRGESALDSGWSGGFRISSRNFSQVACESWTARTVQPPSEGPAAWKICSSGSWSGPGWTAATEASYCSLVPPGKW